MTPLLSLFGKPWIWSWLAAFIVWFLTIMVTLGASTLGLSQAALTFAASRSSSAWAGCSSSPSVPVISTSRFPPP